MKLQEISLGINDQVKIGDIRILLNILKRISAKNLQRNDIVSETNSRVVAYLERLNYVDFSKNNKVEIAENGKKVLNKKKENVKLKYILFNIVQKIKPNIFNLFNQGDAGILDIKRVQQHTTYEVLNECGILKNDKIIDDKFLNLLHEEYEFSNGIPVATLSSPK